jgi:hypothetical protein
MKIRYEVGDKVKISLKNVPTYVKFIPPGKQERYFLHGQVEHIDAKPSDVCQFGTFKEQNIIFRSVEGLVFESFAGNFIPDDVDTRWIKKNKSNIRPDVLKVYNV